MKRVVVVAFIFAALVLAATSSAHPNVHFCNTTVAPIGVALSDGTHVSSRYLIAAGQCVTPLAFVPDMHSLYIFYAPNAQDAYWLGAMPTRDIQTSDGVWRRFSSVDIGRDDVTVAFMSPDAALLF